MIINQVECNREGNFSRAENNSECVTSRFNRAVEIYREEGIISHVSKIPLSLVNEYHVGKKYRNKNRISFDCVGVAVTFDRVVRDHLRQISGSRKSQEPKREVGNDSEVILYIRPYDTSTVEAKNWFFPRYAGGRLHEPALIQSPLHVLAPNSTLYDIGANVSYFTVFDSDVCKNGSVHAFEIDQNLVTTLEYGLERTDTSTTVVQSAVSDSPADTPRSSGQGRRC